MEGRHDVTKSTGVGRGKPGQPRGHRFVDKTGQRFGKLVVIGVAPQKTKTLYTWWRVRCDCGEEKEIRNTQLTPPGRWRCCGARSCLPKREPAPSRYCRCGCGTLFPMGSNRRFVPEHRPRRLWTPEDDALLGRLYHSMTIANVAAALGRPVDSTYHRAYELGIHRNDGRESLAAASVRVGVSPRYLKKRLAEIGVSAGWVGQDGQRFQARVRTEDVDRAMGLVAARRAA